MWMSFTTRKHNDVAAAAAGVQVQWRCVEAGKSVTWKWKRMWFEWWTKTISNIVTVVSFECIHYPWKATQKPHLIQQFNYLLCAGENLKSLDNNRGLKCASSYWSFLHYIWTASCGGGTVMAAVNEKLARQANSGGVTEESSRSDDDNDIFCTTRNRTYTAIMSLVDIGGDGGGATQRGGMTQCRNFTSKNIANC